MGINNAEVVCMAVCPACDRQRRAVKNSEGVFTMELHDGTFSAFCEGDYKVAKQLLGKPWTEHDQFCQEVRQGDEEEECHCGEGRFPGEC